MSIRQYDMKCNLIGEYKTIEDAVRLSGFDETVITSCLRGILWTAQRTQWRYSDYDEIILAKDKRLAPVTPDDKPVRQLLKSGKLYREFPSVLFAGSVLHINPMAIVSRIDGFNVDVSSAQDWNWEYADPIAEFIGKPIKRCKLTGEDIDIFASIYLAAYQTNISSEVIAKCLNGLVPAAGSFIWKVADLSEVPVIDESDLQDPPVSTRYNGYTARGVDKYTLDGEFVEHFDTVTSAAKSVNTEWRNITNCCRGGVSSFNGFVWRYSKGADRQAKKQNKKELKKEESIVVEPVDAKVVEVPVEKTSKKQPKIREMDASVVSYHENLMKTQSSIEILNCDDEGMFTISDKATDSVEIVTAEELFVAKATGIDILGSSFVREGLYIEKFNVIISKDGIEIPEVWRPIGSAVNSDGSHRWEVSNYGAIRWREAAFKDWVMRRDSYATGLKGTGWGTHLVAMFVIMAFDVTTPENWAFKMIYLDDDNNNHTLWNLRWHKAGQQLPAVSNERVIHVDRKNDEAVSLEAEDEDEVIKRKGIAINQFTMDGKYLRTFDTITEAAKFIGKDKTNLRRACKRGVGAWQGYLWSFANADEAGVDLDLRNKAVAEEGDNEVMNISKLGDVHKNGIIMHIPVSDTSEELKYRVTDASGKKHTIAFCEMKATPMSIEDVVLETLRGRSTFGIQLTKNGVSVDGKHPFEVPCEIWKKVKGTTDDGVLLVSTLGRVKTQGYFDDSDIWHDSRIIEQTIDKAGRPYIIYNDDKLMLDNLVAEAFIDKQSKSDVVVHLDADLNNCCAYNLAWETRFRE